MTRSIRACLCLALLLVASVSAAQSRATTGDLTGVAVDQSKAVLPGVVITATNTDTNLIRSSTTGETGRFSLPALPPGSYTLRAELPGFAPRVLDQVVVTLGSAVDVELMLALGGTQEAVFVAAESPINTGRHDRPHAATGRIGDVGPHLRRPARAIEQHHGRRSGQQRSIGRQRARHLQPGGGA